MRNAKAALRKLAGAVSWRSRGPLPSSEGYDIVVRRGDGGEDLGGGESELRDHLRSYGRYLESTRRAGDWGSPAHLKRVGGGQEGIDFYHRDPLPSNGYSIGIERRGGGKGALTPIEKEYVGKLNDYWSYLASAHDVTRKANKLWNDEIERDFPNIEVERKG